MPIIVNQPIILTESQTKKFQSVLVTKIGDSLLGRVTFNIYKDDGSFLQEQILDYAGAEFDTFWSNFNSGTFLYQELVAKDDPGAVIPDDIESEFRNIPLPTEEEDS